jgi:hypothetical protein
MYHKLIDFYNKNSHTMVPQTYKNKKSLGKWVSHQREMYRGKEMSDGRIGLLNGVQFVWNATITM